jgi:hypothetical protein
LLSTKAIAPTPSSARTHNVGDQFRLVYTPTFATEAATTAVSTSKYFADDYGNYGQLSVSQWL